MQNQEEDAGIVEPTSVTFGHVGQSNDYNNHTRHYESQINTCARGNQLKTAPFISSCASLRWINANVRSEPTSQANAVAQKPERRKRRKPIAQGINAARSAMRRPPER